MKFKEQIIKKVTGESLGDFKSLLKERFEQLDRIEKDLQEVRRWILNK